MVPALGISYHSASGNGLLGVGWNLSGLHFITRDPSFGVKYDGGDRYVSTLGGAMILSGDGNYYHKKENYFRIKASTDICGAGPCYFIATDPSGTTYTFGNTADSRIEAVNSSIAPPNSVRVWALNEVRDVFGNLATQKIQAQAIITPKIFIIIIELLHLVMRQSQRLLQITLTDLS